MGEYMFQQVVVDTVRINQGLMVEYLEIYDVQDNGLSQVLVVEGTGQ
jgi:hypothetical protein